MLARSGAISANPPYIFLKPAIPDAARVRIGPALIALTRIAVRPEVGGEIPHGGLQGGLGHAHHVVVRHDLLGAVVRQGQDGGAPVKVRPGGARQSDERIRRDVERQREALAGRPDEAAFEILTAREGQGVDQDVQTVVGCRPALEDLRDLLVGLDVTGLDERRADRLGQRTDPPLDQALDRREADLGTLVVEGSRDPPGDRMVVGDAEDQRVAAVEQAHPCPPASNPRSIPAASG